jgi:hypothetical protein
MGTAPTAKPERCPARTRQPRIGSNPGASPPERAVPDDNTALPGPAAYPRRAFQSTILSRAGSARWVRRGSRVAGDDRVAEIHRLFLDSRSSARRSWRDTTDTAVAGCLARRCLLASAARCGRRSSAQGHRTPIRGGGVGPARGAHWSPPVGGRWRTRRRTCDRPRHRYRAARKSLSRSLVMKAEGNNAAGPSATPAHRSGP